MLSRVLFLSASLTPNIPFFGTFLKNNPNVIEVMPKSIVWSRWIRTWLHHLLKVFIKVSFFFFCYFVSFDKFSRGLSTNETSNLKKRKGRRGGGGEGFLEKRTIFVVFSFSDKRLQRWPIHFLLFFLSLLTTYLPACFFSLLVLPHESCYSPCVCAPPAR